MDLLHGALDMLVLRTLLQGALHGYGIAKSIRSNSDETLSIEFGSLYPSLKRLELCPGMDFFKVGNVRSKSACKILSVDRGGP